MQFFSELALLESPLEPGLTVIEASAGTGKTYSISHLVPRLLLQGVLPDLSKLLLVTFTNDAARELAERVRRVLTRLAVPPADDEATRHPHVAALRPLLADEAARTRLDRALLDLDLLAVSTIHAFCQRTLQQEGSLCGLPVLPVWFDAALLFAFGLVLSYQIVVFAQVRAAVPAEQTGRALSANNISFFGGAAVLQTVAVALEP
jgi:superfamily I DNA/RNA helicase